MIHAGGEWKGPGSPVCNDKEQREPATGAGSC